MEAVRARVQLLPELAWERGEQVLTGFDVAALRGVVGRGGAVAADEGDLFAAEHRCADTDPGAG